MDDQAFPTLARYALREDETQRQVLSEFGDETRMEFRLLNAYLEGLETLRAAMFGWESVALVLASRIFDSLDAAHLLLRRGYATRVGPLIRAADEDLLTWAYIEKHPQDAHFWQEAQHGDPHPKPKKARGAPKNPPGVPGIETMREALGAEDPTAGALGYGVLSVLSHPRSTGMALQLNAHGDHLTVQRGPSFDSLRAGLAYMMLIVTTSTCLVRLHNFLVGRNDAWVSSQIPLIVELGTWMTSDDATSSRQTLSRRIDAALQAQMARASASTEGDA